MKNNVHARKAVKTIPEANLALNYRVNAKLFPVICDSICTNVLIFCVFNTDLVCKHTSFNSEEVRKDIIV